MNKLIKTVFIYLILFGCGNLIKTKDYATKGIQDGAMQNGHFKYDSLGVPDFFAALFENHFQEYSRKYHEAFEQASVQNDISINDSNNLKQYFRIHFFHRLFTCGEAVTGSNTGILKIPYFWHWVDPNPRNEILCVQQNKKLKDLAPPSGFKKYRSFADIDRTPDIFYSDLVSDRPHYYHSVCDSFFTFGWCSEREMAFTLLMENFGLRCKTIAEGNHSWSEIFVIFKNDKGEGTPFEISIDNTFDHIYFKRLNPGTSQSQWMTQKVNRHLPEWYNTVAHSQIQAAKVSNIYVKGIASERIEQQVIKDLN